MPEWESWRDDSSYDSTSDTGQHRANGSKNQLLRVGSDRDLTDQDVKRENGSSGDNQVSADDCSDAAESKKKSGCHVPLYIILLE